MVIGLRSFSDGFTYVILDGTQINPKIIEKDRLSIPKKQTWPAILAWSRKQFAEILEPYKLKSACIKIVEPMSRNKSAERFQIEAVLQEYLYSKRSINCTTKIKSQLKRDIDGFTDFARYIERALTNSDVLAELNTPVYLEAAVAALSELPKN